MSGPEMIVLTFRPLEESAEAVLDPQGLKLFPPAGDNFMGVGLMAHIPYQFVVGRIKHVMERDGQIDDAEGRTEVAAILFHDRFNQLPNFTGQLRQLLRRKLLQVRRTVDALEQGCAAHAVILLRKYSCTWMSGVSSG